jgi:hypothetical protein
MNEERFESGDFIDTRSTFGIIARGDTDEMNSVMAYIRDQTNLTVVYQTSSSNKLYINDDKR